MSDTAKQNEPSSSGAHVVLVGAGVIGSVTAELLARAPEVSDITVVDPDTYEEKNLTAQQIEQSDVGQYKAVVQARRISRISPTTRAEAIVDRVENVAPGRLRADVMLACLDTKAARRDTNALAHHLAMPWIDSGVDAAGGLLARVNVYTPGVGAPCHECGWDARSYETLEVKHVCTDETPNSPTNSPAYLGSLAASIQMTELTKLLNSDTEFLAAGKSIIISARYHTLDVTRLVPNSRCLFDHEIWRVELVDYRPGEVTFGQVLNGKTDSLAVEGRSFVRAARCDTCMRRDEVRTFVPATYSIDTLLGPCRCGGRMLPLGFETEDELSGEDLEVILDVTLAGAGVVEGDILRLTGPDARVQRRQIACDRSCDRAIYEKTSTAETPCSTSCESAVRCDRPAKAGA